MVLPHNVTRHHVEQLLAVVHIAPLERNFINPSERSPHVFPPTTSQANETPPKHPLMLDVVVLVTTDQTRM
jgi:hypothetical protein